MMRFTSLVLVLAVALSGCTDSSQGDPSTGPDAGAKIPPNPEPSNQAPESQQPAAVEPDAQDERGVRLFEADAELGFLGTQGLPTGNSNFAPEGNCVYLFLPSGTKIVSGNATATWSPQSPFMQNLRFRAYSPDGYDVRADETGSSPLNISFGDFTQEEVWLALHTPDPALTVDQKVTMHTQVEYEGQNAPRWETGPCWHPSG